MLDAGLPDPRERRHAWWNGEPAYLAWWRALTATDADGRPSRPLGELLRLYSYAVPSMEALQAIAGLGPVVELGAGAGYWARLLRDLGCDLVAYDIATPGSNTWITDAPTWTDVQHGDERVLAGHADRALFVSWPERPGGVMPVVLDSYPPRTLALITDGRTWGRSSDPLYDRLDAGWECMDTIDIPRWPYRNDRLTIWTRAAHPRQRGVGNTAAEEVPAP